MSSSLFLLFHAAVRKDVLSLVADASAPGVPIPQSDACSDAPCLFNGVHVLRINFASSDFIGVRVLVLLRTHLWTRWSVRLCPARAHRYGLCLRDWNGIVSQHKMSKKAVLHGGDGEVMQDGRVVEPGKWGDKVKISQLQIQCFEAACANVLYEGI